MCHKFCQVQLVPVATNTGWLPFLVHHLMATGICSLVLPLYKLPSQSKYQIIASNCINGSRKISCEIAKLLFKIFFYIGFNPSILNSQSYTHKMKKKNYSFFQQNSHVLNPSNFQKTVNKSSKNHIQFKLLVKTSI